MIDYLFLGIARPRIDIAESDRAAGRGDAHDCAFLNRLGNIGILVFADQRHRDAENFHAFNLHAAFQSGCFCRNAIRPPSANMLCTAGGSAATVRLMPRAATVTLPAARSIAISSPSAISLMSHSTAGKPLLMQLRKNCRPNDCATIAATPIMRMMCTACSREELMPKFLPATITS